MIKTAMIAVATFALFGVAQADVCVPVDGVVNCNDANRTNALYNRACRTNSNTFVPPDSYLVVLGEPADRNESYTVHFAGFDISECTGFGFATCNQITRRGFLYIAGLNGVSGTTQRVGVTRIGNDVEESDPLCEQGLTAQF